MEQFRHIDILSAKQKLEAGDVALVDIRDPQSYGAAHIEGATYLNNDNLQRFMDDTPLTTPVIVCCYHGNSSQQAAQFLVQQGYHEVYSLDGGFEAWRLQFPFVSSAP
ncbi:thiosulfate sulfurtransferase GlpE [Lacimicrobium alkaliphilum]|uniref:Thiosulfate sulfurtransferase GlpE n=1 Tax=Lacimicrobium alkaliphilum TaxID=1526571 RepID=A0ABQ1RRS0_9ALTE|nr:thiosulfate sulfurtransferase GlpE [Lacimicrobium alkaliphilum]GGD77273.1 thiosulfate sulfurtransferase GlpE [Lacimicrobium alkaliphilum]